MTLPIPSEDTEQQWLVQYLTTLNIPHFRVPSETYTTSWSQKAKNKRLGVVKGVPDLFILPVPTKLIAIEMKRTKGSSTSPEQKEWQARLIAAGIDAYICKGFEAAKTVVDSHRKVI